MYSISPLNIDLPANIYIGTSVFINRNVTLEGQGKIIIGDTVQIGPNVVIATTNHELGNMKEIFLDIQMSVVPDPMYLDTYFFCTRKTNIIENICSFRRFLVHFLRTILYT